MKGFSAKSSLMTWVVQFAILRIAMHRRKAVMIWGFGRKVASQLGFDFLDGGQAAAQFLGEGFGELGLPGGDGDGLVQAAQGVLGDELVLSASITIGLAARMARMRELRRWVLIS